MSEPPGSLYIDFFYDFVSPFSYLAATQVPAFVEQHQITIHWVPFLLPQLVKMAKNVPPSSIPRKGLYLYRDLLRWADYLGVPFQMQNPSFFDARPALVGAQALTGADRIEYSLAVFKALWGEGAKPDRPGWVEAIMARRGLPPAWARPADPDAMLDGLRASTKAAYRAGGFGAPNFVLHGCGKPQLYWGVDRMDFLGRAVQTAKQARS